MEDVVGWERGAAKMPSKQSGGDEAGRILAEKREAWAGFPTHRRTLELAPATEKWPFP